MKSETWPPIELNSPGSPGAVQAYPQLSLKQVRERAIHIPEQADQDRIAATLSDIETELTALEARLAKARALKQAMAQALLTGRIRLTEGTAA